MEDAKTDITESLKRTEAFQQRAFDSILLLLECLDTSDFVRAAFFHSLKDILFKKVRFDFNALKTMDEIWGRSKL